MARTDAQILEIIEAVIHPDASSTEEEDSAKLSALEEEISGITQVIFFPKPDEEGLTPEQILAKAKHNIRVIAVGPSGAAITHPKREE